MNVDESGAHFVICGDYKLPVMQWSLTDHGCVPIHYDGRAANEIINMMSLTERRQFNHIKNSLNRTLDLVFANFDGEQVELSRPDASFVPEHHFHPALALTIKIRMQKTLNSNREPKYNFFRGDYDMLNECLRTVDWSERLESYG